MSEGNAVARLRGKARAAATGSRVGQAALARRDRKALIELVVRAGFVDLEWYQAATGVGFDSPGEAVEHYLESDGLIPLGPLLAAGHLPDLDRADSSNDAMVRYLLRGNVRYLPTPVFDDQAYLERNPQAAAHPGRARGYFLGTATADTALPVPDGWAGPVPTFGPWRTQMIKFAAALAAREQLRPAPPDEAASAPEPAAEPSGTLAAESAAKPAVEPGSEPTLEPAYAKFVRESARLIDWDELDAGLAGRDPGRVSILIPTINDWALTDAAVGALLSQCGNHDIEVVVVDNGSNPGAAIGLAQSLVGHDPTLTRIKPVWLPANVNFALGTNVAFAGSTGARVVLLNNDTQVCPGWLDPLLRELNDPSVAGVQPLLLYGDGTVQSAGTAFPDCGGLPSHLLVGHPAEDARRLGNFDVCAATAAAMAMRAADYCRLRGLDPRFINGWEDVDFCLRALAQPGARFRVSTESTVIHFESRTRTRTVIESNRQILWSTWRECLPRPDMGELLGAAGFGVIRWDPGLIGRAGLGRIPLPVISRVMPMAAGRAGEDNRTAPPLRWAVKANYDFRADTVPSSGSGSGPDGGAAGNADARSRAVVNALVTALRELGQEVVVDCRQAHQRVTSGLDDVVLVLADVEQFEPQPGRVNLLWFWNDIEIDAVAVDGHGFDGHGASRASYDQFGFDVAIDHPARQLLTKADWLTHARSLLATAVAVRDTRGR